MANRTYNLLDTSYSGTLDRIQTSLAANANRSISNATMALFQPNSKTTQKAILQKAEQVKKLQKRIDEECKMVQEAEADLKRNMNKDADSFDNCSCNCIYKFFYFKYGLQLSKLCAGVGDFVDNFAEHIAKDLAEHKRLQTSAAVPNAEHRLEKVTEEETESEMEPWSIAANSQTGIKRSAPRLEENVAILDVNKTQSVTEVRKKSKDESQRHLSSMFSEPESDFDCALINKDEPHAKSPKKNENADFLRCGAGDPSACNISKAKKKVICLTTTREMEIELNMSASNTDVDSDLEPLSLKKSKKMLTLRKDKSLMPPPVSNKVPMKAKQKLAKKGNFKPKSNKMPISEPKNGAKKTKSSLKGSLEYSLLPETPNCSFDSATGYDTDTSMISLCLSKIPAVKLYKLNTNSLSPPGRYFLDKSTTRFKPLRKSLTKKYREVDFNHVYCNETKVEESFASPKSTRERPKKNRVKLDSVADTTNILEISTRSGRVSRKPGLFWAGG